MKEKKKSSLNQIIVAIAIAIIAGGTSPWWVDYFFNKNEPDKVQEKSLTETFELPEIDGYRLDYCHTWATDCGAAAATAWCVQEKGYKKAVQFVRDDTDGLVTKTIGSNQLCQDPVKCYSFVSITCSN